MSSHWLSLAYHQPAAHSLQLHQLNILFSCLTRIVTVPATIVPPFVTDATSIIPRVYARVTLVTVVYPKCSMRTLRLWTLDLGLLFLVPSPAARIQLNHRTIGGRASAVTRGNALRACSSAHSPYLESRSEPER